MVDVCVIGAASGLSRGIVSSEPSVTRVARKYGATTAVKTGKLILLPRGGGNSASGKPVPAVTLTPVPLIAYDISFPDRARFAAVRTKAHDRKSGKKTDLTIPNPDAPAKCVRSAYRTPRVRQSGSRKSGGKVAIGDAQSAYVVEPLHDVRPSRSVDRKDDRAEGGGRIGVEDEYPIEPVEPRSCRVDGSRSLRSPEGRTGR
ncbi:hypothetical protein [Burkholderia sp. D-99]|uniref:hypothetical protein n=1 Tax=Burkholderia sp. D-99 TaxID=2717316 RepID=UPI001FB66F15|nr:hypothetical protein [Burkholderia sp. D-99]